MRKIPLFTFFLLLTLIAQSQFKLGLKFSPLVTTSRTSLIDSAYNVEPGGSVFRFSIGLIADYELTDTYFVSTGLIFQPKRMAIDVEREDGGLLPPGIRSFEEYKIQYLQVPVTLKLFTNEVQPDLSIYFQVGLTAEFKVYDEPLSENYTLVEEFRFFDSSAILGAGVEFRAGLNTTLFGGVTYQKGLLNEIKTLSNDPFEEQLVVRNTIVSLDLGIKF